MGKIHRKYAALCLLGLGVLAGVGVAQYGPPGGRSRGFGRGYRGGYSGTPRRGVPEWQVDEDFKEDIFTFVRIKYGSLGGRRWGRGAWATDWPDSDLNFSYRLQELTSMKVHPDGLILELTDARLFDYPFIYLLEAGRGEMYLEDDEIKALRRYLLNGGFLMVDDFWGDWQYDVFYEQIKRVFPDREPQEVPLSHDIFHWVYDLKERPQIPSINVARWGRSSGVTWEGGPDTQQVHYQAIYDDNQRIMVFICHNTDLGDGWEREGEDEWYFHEFSEKKAYPLGINIVTYAMTH